MSQDRFKPVVKLLSWIPSIILLVMVLSFLLYMAMPLIRSIRFGVYNALANYLMKLVSMLYHSYFPSQLNVLNIACLIMLVIFLFYVMSPIHLGYSVASAYVAGIILYFTGTLLSGFMLGLAHWTGGTAPIMPYYGFGIGDFFMAGLLFLFSMSGKTVLTIWRWSSSQLPAMLAIVLAVNVLALTSMWLDKKQSVKPEAYRVPEKAFLRYAVLGGGAGVMLGAFLFRHKTRHRGFLTSTVIASIAGFFILIGGLVV